MGMAMDRLLTTAAIGVGLSLAWTGRDAVGTIVSIPLWTSLFVLVALGLVISSVLKKDRHSVSPTHTRRYGLRTLTFTTPSAWSAVLTRQAWEQTSAAMPTRRDAKTKNRESRLDSILVLIRSSFILPWHDRISPSPAFPNAVDHLVRQTLDNVTKRANEVDWSSILVSRIIPRLTDHVHHFGTVEHLTSVTSSSTNLPLPLPSKVHPALSHQAHVSAQAALTQVETHFRALLRRVVENALPEEDRSEVVKTIVKEVLLGAVLLPVFDMLTDSDFWNRQIDDRGGQYLREQKQVNRFLSALSKLPDAGPDSHSPTPVLARTMPPTASITAASSTRHFEVFLRSISRVKTLGEARRLRSDIEREYRLAKVEYERQLEREHGPSTEADVKRARKYVKRLDRARLEVESRVEVLSKSSGKDPVAKHSSGLAIDNAVAAGVDLDAVLMDPSSLAYWLEYMERRKRSRLVQFWLAVEGFKNPLEGLDIDPGLGAAASYNGQTAAEDLAFLYENYLSSSDIALNIPHKHIDTIRELVTLKSPLGISDGRRGKQAMFSAQQAVYDQMKEEDWSDFKKSELFIKACADLKRTSAIPPKSPNLPSSPDLGEASQVFTPPPPPRRLPLSTRTQVDGRPPLSPISPVLKHAPVFVPFSPNPPSVTVASSTHLDSELPFEARPQIKRQTSSGSNELLGSPNALNVRRNSHLDFLIGGDDETDSQGNRDRLFTDKEDEEVLLPEPNGDDESVEVERMEAIQAALNEIIASDDLASSRLLGQGVDPSPPETENHSMSSSLVLEHKVESVEPLGRLISRSVEDLRDVASKRASVITFTTPSSRVTSGSHLARADSVSSMNERVGKTLFDDEVADNEDHPSAPTLDPTEDRGLFQMALPGDMQLSAEIARIKDKLAELVKQEHLLNSLIGQAELTGNQNELKILRRSLSSVSREQRTLIFQKAQFEQQEEENRLVPGKTHVTIPTAVIGTDERDGGKQFVRYTIEVRQISEGDTASWSVARRYNSFWELDKALREWASLTGNAYLLQGVQELPPKRLVPNLSNAFIESRRQGLQRYLQSLTGSAALCQTSLLRNFLSRSPISRPSLQPHQSSSLAQLAPRNLVKSLYRTMSVSLDDSSNIGPNMLDLMSTTLGRQFTDLSGMVGLGTDDIAGLGNAILRQSLKSGWNKEASTSSSSTQPTIAPLGGESGSGSFTAPICDLFIEVFGLKENNWLRRQAIVVILQQFLGSTVERKVRDTLRSAMSSESVERLLGTLQEIMWPGGERRPPSVPRTDEEKLETKHKASQKLAHLIPDVAANMIGRGNARRAARRVFGALQDKRLNQHLILCIIDEIVGALFPPDK